MAKAKGQNYMFGAAILAAGVVIMKILGAIYKIPIGNIIGDDGYSMFISTYNVFNVFLTLATSGLPVALSRLISEANAQNRPMLVRETFSVAKKTFFVIGLFFTLIMLVFPQWIATSVLHNPDAAMSIRMMSPSVLLVCLVSAYRGYCQGFGNMIPTTAGQVLEVLVKVAVGLVLATIIVKAGGSKSSGSAGAIFGVTAGSATALIFMLVYKKKKYGDEPDDDLSDTADSQRSILKRLLKIGIPIALGASILSILNLIDSSICMARLQSAAGFSLQEAQVLYGVYGKAQTLFNLPAAFITPLTISVVPAIAAANIKGENDTATKISEDSMRIATAICLPMGVGLAVLSEPIMKGIYWGSHESGPVLLAVMGAASFFVCIVLMENAILQASGKEKYPMYTMISGGIIKIVINWFLVADPDINIYGAPLGTLISYVFMAVANFVIMCYVLDKNPKVINIVKGPGAASILMAITAFGVYYLMCRLTDPQSRLAYIIAMAAAIVAAVLVYAVAAIKLKAITAEDMKLIPGGGKIAGLLHMK